jgi:hypothetical protein
MPIFQLDSLFFPFSMEAIMAKYEDVPVIDLNILLDITAPKAGTFTDRAEPYTVAEKVAVLVGAIQRIEHNIEHSIGLSNAQDVKLWSGLADKVLRSSHRVMQDHPETAHDLSGVAARAESCIKRLMAL